MSRRNTVLIAAFVNIGLLLVLFISALKNRDPEEVVLVQEKSIPIASAEETINVPSTLDKKEETVVSECISAKEEVSNFTEITVKKGDMLEKIARQHQTSVEQIMKANNLSSTQLKIGQVLKIKTSSEIYQTPTAKAQAAVLSAAPSNFYTVKAGDNPWTIAVKHHMKVEELLKLNNMSEEKARRLKPGDLIKIR